LIKYYSSRPNLPYAKLDSLRNLANQRFPSGKIAFEMLTSKFTRSTKYAEQDSIYSQAKKDFPKTDFNNIHCTLAYRAILMGDYDRVKQYANLLTDYSSLAFITSRRATKDSLAAEQFARSFIKDKNSHKAGYDYFTAAYGGVLFKLGQNEKALQYAESSITPTNNSNLPFLRYYSTLLERKGRYKDLNSLLEGPYVQGVLEPDLETLLLLSYKKANPEADIDIYANKLKATAKQMIKPEIVKRMLTPKAAPDFILKDINGMDVSLKDFRGKTIVIDFWATWCKLCIAAFPAMQIALDNYKSNPDVKFLFVHTKERDTDATQEAKAFVKDKNYSFDLYMDLKNSKGRNPLADAFEVTGIPAKYVIDKSGKIRFNIVGHMFMKDEKLAEELKAMIDLASQD
jgi:thiol-disulfide isomerase/thioredoxin